MSLDALYSKDVLRLAAGLSADRLDAPSHSGAARNPICGDSIKADVTLAGTTIAAIAFEVKACLLCQASAALLQQHAIGEDRLSINALIDHLHAMMKGAPPPAPPFAGYGALMPVAAHPSRHRCVLLPLDALANALGQEPA